MSLTADVTHNWTPYCWHYPFSWKGTLAQYAGRLNRIRHEKQQITIYDYADLDVPMLKRMFERRRLGYRQVGNEICGDQPAAVITDAASGSSHTPEAEAASGIQISFDEMES